MAIPSYQKYFDKVKDMTPDELHSYQRFDYQPDSHMWPDYLDYIDEWNSNFEYKMNQIFRSYIYTVLVKRQQRIQCEDHYHDFTDQPNVPNTVYFPRPDHPIEHSVCWFKTIRHSTKDLIRTSSSSAVSRLNISEREMLKRLVRIGLVSMGTTDVLLSYTDYQKLWYNEQNKETAIAILNSSSPPEHIFLKNVVKEVTQERNFRQVNTVPSLILPSDVVAADHGLHSLLRVHENAKVILKMINSIRSIADQKDIITRRQLHDALQNCNSCGKRDFGYMTYPGVYYAPPGNGKTTSLDLEVFIGIDTDWLIANGSYQLVVQPFLLLDIPVITNQYDLVYSSHDFVVGMFNRDRLKSNKQNRPFTSDSEIVEAIKVMNGSLYVHFCDGYFTDNITNLTLLHYIHNVTRFRFLKFDIGKVRTRKKFKHNRTSATLIRLFSK